MKNTSTEPQNNTVYYLGLDASMRKELGRRLAEKRLSLRNFERPADLATAAREEPPVILILEMEMLPGDTTLAHYLDALLGNPDPAPTLICIAANEGIERRLQALRAGAKAFFLAPADPAELAAKVALLRGMISPKRHRILIVEDEQSQAMYVALLLTNAGMEVRTVSDSLKVLEALAEFHPDLILMDLYMPGASGAELTAIIRDHDEYYDTPILLLSGETDVDKQIDALQLGGDGFIGKPVHRAHLIASIEHRIRMAHWLRERQAVIAKRGTPTGLLDKEYFMRTLDRALRDGSTRGGGAGLMLVELDSPQQIMDKLGLSGTEKLLTHIERLLGRHLAAADAATRYGDMTYAILARRKDHQALTELADKLRRVIAEPNHELGVASIITTASIGVGLFDPLPDDALAMMARAEKTCAQARQTGGDRVEVWSPIGVSEDPEVNTDDRMYETILEAITADRLVLLFQPIIALGQDTAAHFEAQVRLRTKDGELLPPRDFFPIASRRGLMTTIDRWVLERAMDVLHDHRVRHPDIRLLVHQTMATVSDKNWLLWFREQLLKRDLMRIRPVLQFQIRDLRDSLALAKPLFGVFQKAGVHVCIANVTNSASEIDLVGSLGATMVKLSLHTLAHTDIASLTDLVHHLHDRNLVVIATGIEDQETVTRVWGCRADFLQGNYIQIPLEDINQAFTGAGDI